MCLMHIFTQINVKFGDTLGLVPLFSLNEEGYKRIIHWSSQSFLKNNDLLDPHITFDELLNNHNFLVFNILWIF